MTTCDEGIHAEIRIITKMTFQRHGFLLSDVKQVDPRNGYYTGVTFRIIAELSLVIATKTTSINFIIYSATIHFNKTECR